MKKLSLLLGFLAVLYLVNGCKEVGPPIIFGSSHSADTTYTAATESATPHKVFIEEFSGVSCPNCPQGQQVLKSIEQADSPNVVICGMYEFGTTQTAPITGLSKQDLRDSTANKIGGTVYGGVGSFPSIGVDRTDFGGTTGKLIDQRGLWPTLVTSRLSVASPVNMYLTSDYDPSSKMLTVALKAAFVQQVGRVTLSIGIKEDGIVEAQDDQTVVDTFYTENHVFRAMITPSPTGVPFFDTVNPKMPGRVCQSTYTYKITNTSWNLANCKVFAIISDDSTGQVQQAVETKL